MSAGMLDTGRAAGPQPSILATAGAYSFCGSQPAAHRSSIKRCGAPRTGARWGLAPRTRDLPVISDGILPGVPGVGDFSCSGGHAFSLKLLFDDQPDCFRTIIDAARTTPSVDLPLHALGHHDRHPLVLRFLLHSFAPVGHAAKKYGTGAPVQQAPTLAQQAQTFMLTSFLGELSVVSQAQQAHKAHEMKPLVPIAAAAALFLGVVGQARAGDMVRQKVVGPWVISADAEICWAQAHADNGTNLHFLITAAGRMTVAVTHPAWRIPNGKYSVTAQVDRTPAETMEARVIDNWVMADLILGDHNMNLLSYGRELSLTIGARVYTYGLVRSGAMLKDLALCAATRMVAANPYAGAPQAPAPQEPTNPFPETTSNPYRRM